MPQGGKGRRFVVLDSWRGICALMVALFHFTVRGHYVASSFGAHAFLFVDFFFVLSGFVMAQAYGDRLDGPASARDFLIRRIGRVWPLHVFMLLALIGLELVKLRLSHGAEGVENAAFTGRTAASLILPNALLLHSLGFLRIDAWNIPSWSISVEMAAYLAFAAGMLGFRRVFAGFAVAMVAGSTAVLLAFTPHDLNVSYDFGLFRCLGGFFLGCLAHAAWSRWKAPSLPPRLHDALEIGAVALMAVFLGFAQGILAFLAAPLFALLVCLFAGERGVVSRLLRSAPLVLLGMLSYSIYLVHFPVFDATAKALSVLQNRTGLSLLGTWQTADGRVLVGLDFGTPWLMDLVSAGLLAVTVLLALLTYRFVEVPGRRLFARLAAGRGGRAAVPAIVPEEQPAPGQVA
ncbi:hypothetical protein RGI145_05385 [Roseomonas gilardii]|uniref:Acyltransferase 3 domain-containing protein n=1 Tax=Roseomonas gilardii TaxID=257708 RepID=A0A1L7ACZ6_9PROT|nr:acyltransferase [Roseomonas gilardii]APT56621.1 hypothetical protein RGI145_05385 [Roseomonas gilardii]